MTKTVAIDDQFTLVQQAQQDGAQVGKAHRALGVTGALEAAHVDQLASYKANDLWQTVRRRIPTWHKAWSGNMPTFVALYKFAFLAGYLRETRAPVAAPLIDTATEVAQRRSLALVRAQETRAFGFTLGVNPAIDPAQQQAQKSLASHGFSQPKLLISAPQVDRQVQTAVAAGAKAATVTTAAQVATQTTTRTSTQARSSTPGAPAGRVTPVVTRIGSGSGRKSSQLNPKKMAERSKARGDARKPVLLKNEQLLALAGKGK